MQRVVTLLTASVAIMAAAQNAVADSPNLMGAYGFTRTVTCIVSSFGFSPTDFRALGPSFGESFAERGVRTFNGDGTGTQSFRALNITDPALNPGANSSTVMGQKFTYIINGDGSWTIPGGGSISGTVDNGPRAGQTFTIANIAPSVGWISQNGMTLTLDTVTVPPTPPGSTSAGETITYSDGTVLYRICNRASVHISLPPAP